MSLYDDERDLPGIPETRGLGASRRAQLVADLQLTVVERLRAAWDAVRLSERLRPRRKGYVKAFETYDAYLDWKHGPRREDDE